MTFRTRVLLAACLAVLIVAGGVWLYRTGFVRELSDQDRLISALREGGTKGPLLCVAAQFVQVVIFVIPGEITQFASGYVFGLWPGFVYSVIGIMAGSAFNFYFARLVGRPTLERLISRKALEKADHYLTGARGKSALFLLFLLPGAPKDVLTYGAGLTPIGLVEFVVITGLGRAPALFASIVLGSQASKRDYRSMILTGAILILVVAGYYLYERRRGRQNSP